MKILETYFVRHPQKRISLDAKTRNRMWKERRIFIHFEWDKSGNRRADSSSTNPDDYEGSAKRAVSALCRLASEGGYVCGHYDEHAEWMLGKVLPNSRIELCKGTWPESKRPKYHNGICVLKTLRLHKVRFVWPDACQILQPAQPRQGTIMRWPSIGDAVEAIVEGKRLRSSIGALSPNHQEVLCMEFLRRPMARRFGLPQLECLLRDVGRTMKDVDIFGLATDGRKIFVQVTLAPLERVLWKLEALAKFRKHGNGHLILFCDCRQQVMKNSVTVFPIRSVYQAFVATRTGRRWLHSVFPKV